MVRNTDTFGSKSRLNLTKKSCKRFERNKIVKKGTNKSKKEINYKVEP
jgi:hypothetical protein